MGQCQSYTQEQLNSLDLQMPDLKCCGGNQQNQLEMEQLMEEQQLQKSKQHNIFAENSEEDEEDDEDDEMYKSKQNSNDNQFETDILQSPNSKQSQLNEKQIQQKLLFKKEIKSKKLLISQQKEQLIKCSFYYNSTSNQLNKGYSDQYIGAQIVSGNNQQKLCHIPSHMHNKPDQKKLEKGIDVEIDEKFAKKIKSSNKINNLIEKYPSEIEKVIEHLPKLKMDKDAWYKKYKKQMLKEDYYYIEPQGSTSGFAYKGMWYDGKPFGFGIMLFYIKTTLKQKFKINIVYQGEINNNKANGYGRMIQQDGCYYQGFFFDNEFHGQGKLVKPDGFVYEGEFQNGKQHGRGTEVWPNGSTYRGEYYKGKKHGEGKFNWQVYFVEQDEYWGGMFNDLFQDFGIYKWHDGRRYTGSWLHGKMSGYGEFFWPDGSLYRGFYELDHKQGYGIMQYYGHEEDDPKFYEGYWHKGEIQNYKNEYFYKMGDKKKDRNTNIVGYLIKKGLVRTYIFDQQKRTVSIEKKEFIPYDQEFMNYLEEYRNFVKENNFKEEKLNSTPNQQNTDIMSSQYKIVKTAQIAQNPISVQGNTQNTTYNNKSDENKNIIVIETPQQRIETEDEPQIQEEIKQDKSNNVVQVELNSNQKEQISNPTGSQAIAQHLLENHDDDEDDEEEEQKNNNINDNNNKNSMVNKLLNDDSYNEQQQKIQDQQKFDNQYQKAEKNLNDEQIKQEHLENQNQQQNIPIQQQNVSNTEQSLNKNNNEQQQNSNQQSLQQQSNDTKNQQNEQNQGFVPKTNFLKRVSKEQQEIDERKRQLQEDEEAKRKHEEIKQRNIEKIKHRREEQHQHEIEQQQIEEEKKKQQQLPYDQNESNKKQNEQQQQQQLQGSNELGSAFQQQIQNEKNFNQQSQQEQQHLQQQDIIV